ncbi:MAG TPA: M1 family aminopeptidase [Bacteroidota bacterium]
MKTRSLLSALLTFAFSLPALPQTGSRGFEETGSCAFKAAGGARKVQERGDFSDPGIHVTYYRLRLTLSPSSALLTGEVEAKAVCVSESLSTVQFDLSGSMTVDSVLGDAGSLPFIQFLQGFQVQLKKTYRKGEILTLRTYYRGVPVATGFGSFEFSSQGGVPWIWTLSEPYGARNWWPCKDDNGDKADSVDMFVTVPAGLKVGSNGTLAGTQANGDGTTTIHWSERYPIAVYLVSLAATNYAEIDDWFRYSPSDSMPIVNYVLPQSLSDGVGALAETKSMLRIFSDAYGLYPFINEKYGHAQFGWGGAMEHQTMTSTTNFAENTISHELAHQWFGDMITCANWPNLWLNEGFAVFSESVFLERFYGAGAYKAHIGDVMTAAMNATGTLYVQDTSTVANLFDFNRVYAKGAWTLHMLRHVLGDSVFFRSMRAYAADPRFRFRSATTEGFRSVCESVSGKNLGYFFDEWVYGEGYPRYRYRWTSAPSAGGYGVTLTLSQTGSSPATPFFRMPVDIRLVAGARDTTLTVFHTVTGETFTLQVPFPPADLQIDPDKWILRDVTPPDAILPESYALAQNYPNPFNPGTWLSFSLPHRSDVTLTVYDPLGREIAVLLRGQIEAGTHTMRWEGTDAGGNLVASGTYFYRLKAGTYTGTRKMMLVR